MPLCSQAQAGVAGQALDVVWVLLYEKPCLSGLNQVNLCPNFFQAIPLVLCFVYFLVCCAYSLGFLYFERQTCSNKLPSSAHISFPLAFSPTNVITAHLVKTDKGMRRRQIIRLQFYKSTGPIHADFSSITSVSQQEVRQAEQSAPALCSLSVVPHAPQTALRGDKPTGALLIPRCLGQSGTPTFLSLHSWWGCTLL